MKLLSLESARRRLTLLRMNVVLGVLVFFVGFYLVATIKNISYAEARAAASLYNGIALGGILYAAIVWMFCVLSKPYWFPRNRGRQGK